MLFWEGFAVGFGVAAILVVAGIAFAIWDMTRFSR